MKFLKNFILNKNLSEGCAARGREFCLTAPLARGLCASTQFLFYIWDLSSAGRASALQAEGHRFEPCRSHYCIYVVCRCGGIGRRPGLKIPWVVIPVPVRPRSPALFTNSCRLDNLWLFFYYKNCFIYGHKDLLILY